MKSNFNAVRSITFLAAISAASTSISANGHMVADFMENLSELSGKGNSEVNYITDLTTFEEREVNQLVLNVCI